jgi:hypothetical protein
MHRKNKKTEKALAASCGEFTGLRLKQYLYDILLKAGYHFRG